jgi:hypothetical protein
LVSVVFNVCSVAANGFAIGRTRAHFRRARLDARNDKLRAEIAGLFGALSERSSVDQLVKRRRDELGQPTAKDLTAMKEIGAQTRLIIEETLAPLHYQVATHAFLILMLTNDDNITSRVQTIEQTSSEELTDLRKFAVDMAKVKDVGGLLTFGLKSLGTVARGLPRQAQIVSATAELREYCLQHLPVIDE